MLDLLLFFRKGLFANLQILEFLNLWNFHVVSFPFLSLFFFSWLEYIKINFKDWLFILNYHKTKGLNNIAVFAFILIRLIFIV